MGFDFKNGEILLINKPYGWTSFDAVKKVRNTISKVTGQKKIKVGHAGTLDPLASGLLIICTGKFTRKIDEFQNLEKEYTGTFSIGATTPSFDCESVIDHRYETAHIDESLLRITARRFEGEQFQAPPVFSAINVKGTRAYHKARNKEDFELPPRKVYIRTFEITSIALPQVGFRVCCSKGTYIRSLARDFGKALDSGAYLTSLARTRIGEFSLTDAIPVEDFEFVIKTGS
ncbi:MAG: tRNA pseudouridine(55) synthase TruB [Bacteroidetes bacterium]|nr:tRNA pseudouridine(55) synthase TruB [Bacteroidota bacterium]